jgi:hypothetical protein
MSFKTKATLGVLLIFATLTYGQKSKKNSFWTDYKHYKYELVHHVEQTKDKIAAKYKLSNPNEDSIQLLCHLILFDYNEMNGNIEQLKNYGLKLKSQTLYFDNQAIRSLIYIRSLKMLLYTKDDFGFETEFYPFVKKTKKIRDYGTLATAYGLMAYQKANTQQRDSAVYYINLSLSNARKQTDKNLLIDCILDQASVYQKIKNDEVSLSKAYMALQLALENNYDYGKYLANLILASINSRHSNWEEVTMNMDQAKVAAQRINFQKGIYYVELFKYQLKSTFTDEDKQNFARLKQSVMEDPSLLAVSYGIEAQIALQAGDFSLGLQRLNNALVEFEKTNDSYNIQKIYQTIASVLIMQKKYDKAIVYLNKSMELLNSLNEYSESTLLLRKLAKIYDLKGDKVKAYSLLNKYINLKDSLQIADVQAHLLALQQQTKADDRERLITLQSDSIKIQQKEKAFTNTQLENVKLKNNLKTYVIIGFAGLILAGGIIIFFKWNQNLIQQRQREAELNQTLLRTQMNPHFVFNAMSVIQSYIYDNDTKNSTKFLVNFSRLMRLILENSSKEFIPMHIEQEILEKYLSVQKLRFEDRFNFNIFVDAQLINEGIMIPPMITQPFIENAIEHGQLHLKEDGFIQISFKKMNNKMIEITVTDNGIGRKKAAESTTKKEEHKSMAIGITKDRIESLNKKYKTEGKLIFEDLDKIQNSGTVVNITIPFSINYV